MLLRLGRVYPLHVAVLAAMLAVEIAGAVLGIGGREAFAGRTSPDALLGSLAMVHIFGIWPGLVWNGPSWSIAAEVWTYLTFAIVCALAGARHTLVMGVLAIACAGLLMIDGGTLDRTWSMSLARCIFGFGLGVVAAQARALPAMRAATALEVAVVVAVIGLLSIVAEPLSFIMPAVFVLAVLVFAGERGAVSRLLVTAPMRWLGMLSYSIYMIHAFVLARLVDAAGLIQHRLGMHLVEACGAKKCFGSHGANIPIIVFVFFGVLIAGSWLSYRLIETPGREWSRRFVKARQGEQVATHAAF